MENETQKPKKKFYKRWWFWVLAGVVFFIGIGMLAGSMDSGQPAPQNEKVSVGSEGTINYNKDKSNCDGAMVLGTSKESQEKVSKALAANDTYGLAQLLLTGEGIKVQNCTKVKVIDSSVGLREVRILEGDNIGKSGWLPYEWVLK